MGDKLFKASFLHPYTNVPLIASFNAQTKLLSFEKDEEMIQLLMSMKEVMIDGAELEINTTKTDHITKAVYPINELSDVIDFLERLGVEKETIQFKEYHLH